MNKRILRVGVLAVSAAVLVWLAMDREKPAPAPPAPPSVSRQTPPPAPPELLEPREATTEHPHESWERLLARDGSPQEDRDALADIVTNYLQSQPDSRRPPLGTNDEITRALTDRDVLGDAALPASHPGIVGGQLVDRWSTPWFFHQQSADLIEVRSAGPDRRLFTEDDLVGSYLKNGRD
jgi:hypothetical protein